MNETRTEKFGRRSFLGVAGAGLLGAAGWLAGCMKRGGANQPDKPPLD